MIIAGGSLATALRKARAEDAGEDASIGAAGDPANKDEKAYVPTSAVERARQLLRDAEANDVQVVLPKDFLLEDGTAVSDIPPDAWQRDIGPETRTYFDDEAMALADADFDIDIESLPDIEVKPATDASAATNHAKLPGSDVFPEEEDDDKPILGGDDEDEED